MKSTATTPEQYLAELPEDRRETVAKLRKVVLDNIPAGFEEVMGYGMLGYVVPHSIFPAGYHCNPRLPLPFVNIASQKNSVNFYHMGLYGNPKLLEWFKTEYPKHSKQKPDMGKSCLRFKKPESIPYDLIAELMKKITVAEWIAWCQQVAKR
jgi:hypothetical protein